MSDMSLGETNKANNGTELVGGTFDENWGGNDYIFRVDGDVISPLPPGGVVGIRCSGFGGVGIEGIGGVKGVATEGGGTFGVQGVGNRYGVEGLLAGAEIPENRTEQAAVVGSAAGNFGIGVMGISNDLQGVLGSSQTHNGVDGLSTSGDGVHGNSFLGVGVRGEGGNTGVLVFSQNGTGVSARGSQFAGFFFGSVMVFRGDFTVIGGEKSAAVPHPDGSHRKLYSLESPESWFEDFGEGNLVSGKAEIVLDPEFARIVRTDKYHVFVTPNGDSHGLCVTKRNHKAFEVREQQGGKSNLTFSYRVVAKRNDVKGERLAKVTLPPIPPEFR
jgi:hypothetical protein